MAEKIEVKPGQVWADNDWRAKGRTLRVDDVKKAQNSERLYALCTVLTNSDTAQADLDERGSVWHTDTRGKKVQIRVDRMRPTSTGYRLLEDS
jgi:hypothetical protein